MPASLESGQWSCRLSFLSGRDSESGHPLASGYFPSQPTPQATGQTGQGEEIRNRSNPHASWYIQNKWKKKPHFSQLSDIFHKPIHHSSNVQHIHRVSEACGLQGVWPHLMGHSDSIWSVDGHLLSEKLQDKAEHDRVKWTHYCE